jgi:hypothetical protein
MDHAVDLGVIPYASACQHQPGAEDMYRFSAAMVLLVASAGAASAQGFSIWQSQRGAILKVYNIDRATGNFSGTFLAEPTGPCPGVNYDLAGQVQRAQRRVVFTTSRTWTPDCAVTTVWSGRALGPSQAVVRWSARYVAPNGRVVRTHGTEVFRRI